MRSRRGRRHTPAAVAAGAALILGLPLAACGGPSSAQHATPNAQCPATPGITPTTITIGLIYPDTGSASTAFQPIRGAIQARLDLANAQGGIHGRKVQIEWRDDQTSSDTFLLDAQDLVQRSQVFGLFVQSVVLDSRSADWLKAQGIPVVGLATSPLWGQYPNLFHYGSLFNKGGAVDTFGRYVKAQGGTRALVVADATAPTSQSLAQQLSQSLASQGVQVVGEMPYTMGVSSPAKVAELMQRDGVDTLVGALTADGFIDIYVAARKAGIPLAVALSANSFGPAELQQRHQQMAGMSMTQAFQAYSANTPAIQAYKQTMSQYAPEVTNPFDDLAITSYAGTAELLLGLNLAGQCPTRQSFITNLRAVKSFDGDGLLAPTDVSRPADPATCFNFLKANQAGTQFDPVAGNSPTGFWCGLPVTGSTATLSPISG
jgi:ABC-type branched-subunit amino acid transport system substrate-binding protein